MTDPIDFEGDFGSSALGTFSHELRTPLAALRMILDLGAPVANADGGKSFDAELVQLLEAAARELGDLVDDLQDFSRAERRQMVFTPTLQPLAALFEAVPDDGRNAVTVTLEGDTGLTGNWDPVRARRALMALAAGVDRMGDHSGLVRATASYTAGTVHLVLSSENPTSEPEASEPTAPIFAYFAGAAVVIAMGVALSLERRAGHCRLSVILPPGN